MKGHVRKRGRKWCFVVDIGPDPLTGKRKQKWFSGYNTKRDAQRALAEKLTEIHRGDYIEPAQIPLGELLLDWLEQQVQPETSVSTFVTYSGIVKNHIIPSIGRVRLDHLKPIHFQKLYTEKRQSGLASSTIRLIHNVCRRALNWAVRMGMLARSPVDQVTPPQVVQKEMKFWTAEEAKTFLETAEDSPYYTAFYVAIFTGMRMGELRALKWTDIDWEGSRISIRRRVQFKRGEIVIQSGTKTSKHGRVIEISESVVARLKKHRVAQAKQLLQLGGNRDNWVFLSPKGNLLPDITLYKAFIRLTKKAGLPQIRFHDLRHTHATLLLQQGVHPKIVSERLGHSTISMTLDIYSHVIPSMQKEAAQMFDHLFQQDAR